ncbi:hypothetical protein ACFOY2_03205 [Nonomuraea purpurea]|uniref:Secreted protein n=1 Tax=Nonomuraea purpurea TaxID=1849276 RepID=A0ABV8FWT1_9ACTN
MRSRAWAVLPAVVAACLLAAQPATAQAPVKFHADSGDQCQRGVTEGTLEWVEGPVVRPAVRVAGDLTDGGVNSPCAIDDMYSRASFSAYNGTTLVDTETVKADDGTVPVALSLSDATGVAAIDRVVVQVCRFSNTPIGLSYCGPVSEYKR